MIVYLVKEGPAYWRGPEISPGIGLYAYEWRLWNPSKTKQGPVELSWAHSSIRLSRLAVRKGRPSMWVTQEDYPKSMNRSGRAGIVTVQFVVGTDGRASNCRVVRSSGALALDQATCATILRRARYSPAVGTDGMPIDSTDRYTFTWKMPR